MKNGATHYWSLDKLKQRLEDMRHFLECDYSEMPGQICESSMNGGGWLAALSLNPARLRPNRLTMEQVLWITVDGTKWMVQVRSSYDDDGSPLDTMDALIGADPFYDRFPWFRMIGRYGRLDIRSPTHLFQSLRLLEQHSPWCFTRAQSGHCEREGRSEGISQGWRIPFPSINFFLQVAIDMEGVWTTPENGVRQSAKLHFRKEDFKTDTKGWFSYRERRNEEFIQTWTFPPTWRETKTSHSPFQSIRQMTSRKTTPMYSASSS